MCALLSLKQLKHETNVTFIVNTDCDNWALAAGLESELDPTLESELEPLGGLESAGRGSPGRQKDMVCQANNRPSKPVLFGYFLAISRSYRSRGIRL